MVSAGWLHGAHGPRVGAPDGIAARLPAGSIAIATAAGADSLLNTGKTPKSIASAAAASASARGAFASLGLLLAAGEPCPGKLE